MQNEYKNIYPGKSRDYPVPTYTEGDFARFLLVLDGEVMDKVWVM